MIARFGPCIATMSALLALAGGSVAASRSAPKQDDPVNFNLCQSNASLSRDSFYREMSAAHARMHHAMEHMNQSGSPDRDFIADMIPRHQGAIDMALVLLKYGCDPRVRRLAQSIIIEQQQEIAYMRTLLDAPSNPIETNRIAPD
ncbi:MAG: hypothetical protein JWL62_2060 [Hyphomicrobiales bacterium]|nr:hypothetical protein [Hyphomicrobiales bacterium]